MTTYYEKDGKWYVPGFYNCPDVGPLSSTHDAQIVHTALMDLYDKLRKHISDQS